MATKLLVSNVEGNRCRGRSKLGRKDGAKRVLGERGMSVEQGIQNALDKRRWESIVGSE